MKQPQEAAVLVFLEEKRLLETLPVFLKEEGYDLEFVETGDVLVEKIVSGRFDVLIAEVQLLIGAGNPLLRQLRSLVPDQKVLLLTDFSRISEAKQALDLGFENFLPRPIIKAGFSLAMHEMFEPKPTFDNYEENYARVPIEDFIYGTRMAFAIFARQPNGKFVRIASQGQNLDIDVIEMCKARGLSELWLERSDFDTYLELSQERAQRAVQDTEMDVEQKTKLVAHACEVATENLRIMGVKEETIAPARDLLSAALTSVGTGRSALSLLENLEKQPSSIYARAATCGILAGLIAKVMGWLSDSRVLTLALGAYLHDVGLNFLPKELQRLSEEEMTPEQLKLYRTHPILGADAIGKVRGIPREVIPIVMQHHENNNGTGFPKQLSANQIFPMAKIVALLDAFFDESSRGDPSRGVHPVATLDVLLSERPGCFEELAVLALRCLFVEPNIDAAARRFAMTTGLKSTRDILNQS